jgi:GT2 family glycosyltransferase
MNIKNNKYPLVSVITVNYNQSNITMDLLKTLKQCSWPNIEIIVIDNASPADHPQRIRDAFPSVTLIKSRKNLGFAGGNNLGIRASKGDYLLFLNNDTEVPPGFIKPMVDLFEKNKSIGMVSPKIKLWRTPSIIQYAGISRMNPFTVRNYGKGYYKKDGPEFDHLSETGSVHGAAMMVPRRVIREAGMMSELYFLYYEEHDWAEKIRKAGYKIYYQPASTVLHKESVTTGKESPLKTYYMTRNRLIFARRNFSGFPFIISWLFQTFVSIPKNTVLFLMRKELQHFKAYYKAIIWNIVNYKIEKNNPRL